MVQAMLGRGCSHFARAALVGLLVCASAAPALAQGEDESEARMHFRVGRAYYDSGRFLEAAHEFEEAYRQSDRPQLLYNIFVAYRDAGRLQEAMEALRRYLELVPDAENRDQLTARLAAMERVAARQATAPSETTPSETTPSETAPSETAPAETTDTAEATATTEATATSEAAAATETSEGATGGGGLWVPGFIIGGVGAAAAIAGVITGVLALDAQASLESDYNCDAEGRCDPGFEGARDSGATLAGLTDGLLIGGLVVAATGVVLAFVLADDGGDEDTARFDFSCGPTGCMAGLRGQLP